MVKKLISKAELARLAGVTAGAVTKAIKNGLVVAMDGKRIDVNHRKVVEYLAGRDDVKTEEPAAGIDPLYDDVVVWFHDTERPSIAGIQRDFKIGYNRAAKIKKIIEVSGADKTPPDATGRHATTKKAEALAKFNDKLNNGTVVHEIPEDIEAFIDMTLREIIQRYGTDTAFLDWLNATKRIEDINEKRIKNAQTRGELVSRKLMKTGVIDPIDEAFNKMLTDGADTISLRVSTMAKAGKSLKECKEFVADQIGSFIRPAKAKIVRSLKNA